MSEERQPGILIVDDEPVVGRTVSGALAELSDDLVVVTSGAAAIAACTERAFDVVISDMRMPGMDGVELLAQLAHSYPSMRRIILTGHADLERTMGAINAGRVHRYLTKPCPIDDLRTAVAGEWDAARKERQEINRLRDVIDKLADT